MERKPLVERALICAGGVFGVLMKAFGAPFSWLSGKVRDDSLGWPLQAVAFLCSKPFFWLHGAFFRAGFACNHRALKMANKRYITKFGDESIFKAFDELSDGLGKLRRLT